MLWGPVSGAIMQPEGHGPQAGKGRGVAGYTCKSFDVDNKQYSILQRLNG